MISKYKGTLSKLKTEITSDSLKLSSSLKYKNDWMHLMFSTKDTTQQDVYSSECKNYFGCGNYHRNCHSYWMEHLPYIEIIRTYSKSEKDVKSKKENVSKTPKLLPVSYPNGAYGFTELPQAETILFKNATVWTNESDGILENTDVLVKDGTNFKNRNQS